MSKNLTENYPIVDTVEALEERLAGVREAQRIFAAYTQEQVDKIFTAAALAANKARIPLAKLAVEETGMGIVEDKNSPSPHDSYEDKEKVESLCFRVHL